MAIEFIKTNNIKRTFGWIQDPGSFSNLRKVVELFLFNSNFNRLMKVEIIPSVVKDIELQKEFIRLLDSEDINIEYKKLVGNHNSQKSRKDSICNGIIQAAVPGQIRNFIGDWPADNFLRWAHALGFLEYDYDFDSFYITRSGVEFISTEQDSTKEKEILIASLCKYPPVHRILSLLRGGEHLTKFELGSQLGFVGEGGFTSLPQNIFIMNLQNTESKKEKSSMRADWEGSSDKYARMICGWLINVGLLIRKKKKVDVRVGNDFYSDIVAQSYLITPQGLSALRQLEGVNKQNKIVKSLFWEMLGTKTPDRNYIRTRRAYIVSVLEQKNGNISLGDLYAALVKYGFKVPLGTIKDDIIGLQNIGLNISANERGYRLLDSIDRFRIPLMTIEETRPSDMILLKERLTEELLHLSHKYLNLLDLAYDGISNRLFEMEVVSLLVNEVGFVGAHLGGSRKPDGVIYTQTLDSDFGVIIDTKAYSKGYSLPISQADEMRRYVDENTSRSKTQNPNEWWKIFPSNITNFAFTFISSEFVGNFVGNLNNVVETTGVSGSVVNITNLIRLSEKVLSNELQIEETFALFSSNIEIEFRT